MACATWVSTAASYEYWLTAVIVGFHCHVISCAIEACGLVRPRSATAAESSACGRGNVVGLTSILDRGQFSWFNNAFSSSVRLVTRLPVLCLRTPARCPVIRRSIGLFRMSVYRPRYQLVKLVQCHRKTSPLPLTYPHDAVPRAHRAVHKCRQSVW